MFAKQAFSFAVNASHLQRSALTYMRHGAASRTFAGSPPLTKNSNATAPLLVLAKRPMTGAAERLHSLLPLGLESFNEPTRVLEANGLRNLHTATRARASVAPPPDPARFARACAQPAKEFFTKENKFVKMAWDLLGEHLEGMTVGQLAAMVERPGTICEDGQPMFAILKGSARRALGALRPFNIDNVPSIVHDYSSQEVANFKRLDFKYSYVNSSTRLANVPSEVYSDRNGVPSRYHKCILVSGESGAGKTFVAVKGLPHLLFPEGNYDNQSRNCPVAFHTRIKGTDVWSDQQDRDMAKLSVDERNKVALGKLRQIWTAARGKLQSECPNMGDEDWRCINAVLVLDEIGSLPTLVRGLEACLREFEDEVRTVVAGFRLVLVGAGLDWVVLKDRNIGWNPTLHIRINAWHRDSLERYLAESRIPPLAVKEVMQNGNLVALGSNARCASFIKAAVIEQLRELECDTEDTYIPLTVTNAYKHIFRQVAMSYAGAHDIDVTRRFDRSGYNRIIRGSLRLAMQGKVSGDDEALMRECLKQGVLSYGYHEAAMSPALLLMVSSGFGWRDDIPVIGPDSFTQLVALREMAKIITSDAKAKVAFCYLPDPMPPTYKADDSTSFPFIVPGMLDFEKGRLVSKCPPGVHLIVVNGSHAHVPDVFVIAPNSEGGGKGKVRFVLAKRHQSWFAAEKARDFRKLAAIHQGWEKEAKEKKAEEEAKAKKAKQAKGKKKTESASQYVESVKEADVEQVKPSPASRCLLQSLAAGRQVERVVVVMLPTFSDKKSLEDSTRAEDWLSVGGGEVAVKCEVVEGVWRQILVDT